MLRAQEGLQEDLLGIEVYLEGMVVGVGRLGQVVVCLEGVQGILAEVTLRGGQGI